MGFNYIMYGKLLKKPEVHKHLPDIVKMVPLVGMMASILESTLVKNEKLIGAIKRTGVYYIRKSGVQTDDIALTVLPQKMGEVPSAIPDEMKEMMLTAVARIINRLVIHAVQTVVTETRSFI